MRKIAESFLMGHPDKLCDQVADTIVDEFLRRDKETRANIEVFAGHGAMMISGEVDSRADFDVGQIAKRVYKDAGYDDDIEPFVHLGSMKREWTESMAKNSATNHAICYGYATKATREMLPTPVVYAHALAQKIDEARQHNSSMKWLKPDGRVMVAMQGREVTHVSIFVSHAKNTKVQEVHGGILEHVIKPVIGSVENVKLFVNPAGPFTKGGLSCNTGQSGRQSASDLYGGLVPHVGLSLSGKDPSHPSRAGSYMARYIARKIVNEGKATQSLVKIVYIIGRADPVIVEATGDKGEDLTEYVKQNFDLKIASIVEKFQLKKPIYRAISTYGHVGVADLPWER
jgi:S-adenosylmethionine synthetase